MKYAWLISCLIMTWLYFPSSQAEESRQKVATPPGVTIIRSDISATQPSTRATAAGTELTIPPSSPVILIPAPGGGTVPVAVPDSPTWRWLAPLLTTILTALAAAFAAWAAAHAKDANQRSKNTNDRVAMMDPPERRR